ncbi:DeoR/GlpR family DNA-binding transcription regulator [Streptomyces sp. NBC_01320]|uniref:DeoR/GlpR family DNA-binding transcription regulator n=1 Tax=Streptomyces sp. NBC_01320 TaxID=2903824 RepID=UPI002E15B26A|nr:DeoR/GlpR family DNA-binding transcription regulator [Streptomyces sp. NBC_01320]
MSSDKRRHTALTVVRRDGAVAVSALAAELGVSVETVRRDLRALEERGLVRRTHGGAYPAESAGYETTLTSRATRFVPQKIRIAAAAAKMLGDAKTVFIDEGFTPQLVAAALPEERPLNVITSSLTTAGMICGRRNTQVMLLGGRVRGNTAATVDHWLTEMLAECVIDLAYVGANGISREFGLTTPDPAVSHVKSQAMHSAKRRIFSGIHTKFGAVSFCRFAKVEDFEALITDTSLSRAEAQRYALLGPQVIRV